MANIALEFLAKHESPHMHALAAGMYSQAQAQAYIARCKNAPRDVPDWVTCEVRGAGWKCIPPCAALQHDWCGQVAIVSQFDFGDLLAYYTVHDPAFAQKLHDASPFVTCVDLQSDGTWIVYFNIWRSA